ncbi:hypothetical protein AGMMS50268_35750 [Spirochaetia bacterium]|nr:hypothetical protein AGMMS50268_35750 [Spirochaetia bacterium]
MASPAFAPLQESAAGACAALVSFGGEFQEVAHAGEATPQPASVVNGREGALFCVWLQKSPVYC